jgi:gliding motility-associated-like protein
MVSGAISSSLFSEKKQDHLAGLNLCRVKPRLCELLLVSLFCFVALQANAFTLSFTTSDYSGFGVSCNGSNDGSVDLTVTGATLPIDYDWSNGETTEDISGLVSGWYIVTVIDAVADTVIDSVFISEPDVILLNLGTADANGAPNGEAWVAPTGGAGGYSFQWSTGSTNDSIFGLLPGNYTITVTDINICNESEIANIQNAAGACAIVLDSLKHVTCNGLNNGAIYISVTATIPPVTYQWSNGATTDDITGLAAGSYTVTITDLSACTATATYVVSQPAALSLSLTPTTSTCNLNNGSVTSTPGGGTTPYSYLWSGGQTSQNITNVAAGTYTLTVTDANNCTISQSAVVGSLPPPVVVLDSVRHVRCNGASTGGIFISVSSGTAPFGYLWTGGSTSQDLTNVVAGTYTVTVTDANSCTAAFSTTINQPAALSLSLTPTTSTCNLSNGSVTSTTGGGTTPYSYLWSGGQTSQNIAGLSPGTYTLTVTDANSCSIVQSAVVGSAPPPAIVLDSVRNVKCFGQATGGIFISVTGGTSPFGYQWTGGSTSQDLTNVVAGTYTVTVTDANLCTATLSSAITQPATALNDSITKVNTTCGNNNGSATIYPYNGTSPYTYLWSNTQTSQTISGLSPGPYTVTITDANSCTRTRSVTINATSFPNAVLDSVRHVRCFGASTGGVFISAPGSVLPVVYLWSNGSSSSDLINVPAGTYTMTVTDANGCTSSVSGTVNQPASALNDSVQVNHVTCIGNNGSITAFAYGGTAPYSYLWSTFQTGPTISGLVPGTYTVSITDANACTRLRTVPVNTVASLVATVDSIKHVSCFGGSNGIVYLTASGGTPPYLYLWSTGATTQNLINVPQGTYTVTVFDASACTAQATATVNQPAAALNDSVQFSNATCGNNNGSITVFAYNGTAPYSYLWSTGQTSQTITGLAPALYTVTITDNNGCTRQRAVNISSISGPTVQLDSVRNVNCFGAATGAIYISVSGGTPPFSYNWSSGASSQDLLNVIAGTYTVTVTDANACTAVLSATIGQTPSTVNDSLVVNNASCGAPTGNATVYPYGGSPPYSILWSTGSASNTIFNLGAGSYTVTITDALGCTRQDVAVVTNTNPPIVSIDSIVNVKCFGQSNGGIYVTVTSGQPPYGYQWSNGSGNQDLTNVGVGNYTVTVTDAGGCSVVVSGSISQPTVLNGTLTINHATCGFANGDITANPVGGTSPYSYLWNNNQTTQTISGLAQGTYTVTITDLNGCTKVVSGNVLNSDGPIVSLDSIVDVKCFGDATGAIYISVSGGAPPLNYLWSNTQSTQDITGLAANTYTVTVTDQNSCSVVEVFTVNQPSALADSVSVIPATCGLNNGAITIYSYGGTTPYSYLWSNAATTQTITGLSGGPYSVTVTDGLGCTRNSGYLLPAFSNPDIVTDSLIHVKCNGNSTGAIYISVNGGALPLTFNWSNSVSTEDNLNILAGNYTVVVTDAYSCVDSATFVISQPPLLQDSLNTNPATCNLNNGSAKIYPYGGLPGYSYMWSNGQTSQTAINLAPGIHTVTVTDQNGCQIVRNANISSIPIQVINTDSIRQVNCNGASTGGVFINVSSGAPPYNYLWSNGTSSQDLTGVLAGTYTVTVTDSVNCSINQTFIIGQSAAIVPNSVFTDATCGLSNGTAGVNPSGGVAPYQYLWNTSATTPGITGLAPAAYTVTITDSLGCTSTQSFTISNIPGPDLQLNSITNATCFGGSDGAIDIGISNGTGPINILWSNNDTTEDIFGLVAGIYTVTITDANNCTATASYTVGEATQIQPGELIEDATCGASNGSITLNPTGGSGPYTYLWSDLSTSNAISSLAPGIYTVTITDSLSCSENFQFTVANLGSPVITVDQVNNILCAGDTTGGILISVSGGTTPYTYLWSNTATSANLVNVIAGTYTVTVTDVNNCTSVSTNTINEPPVIEVTFDIVPANCNTANGSIQANITGGVNPYQLLWSSGGTSPLIENLSAGSYTLTVTDQNNCEKTFVASVSNLSAPVIAVVDSGNVTCAGGNNGFITVSVTGGQMPYIYSWTNTTQTGNQLTNLAGNITYTLTITDDLGCIAIRSIFISQPAPIVINAIVPQRNDTFNLTCFGSDDGSIKLQLSGGNAPYTYIWSNLAQVDSIGGLAAGNYTVTVTDANACTAIRVFRITQPPQLISLAGPNNVICGIDSDTMSANLPTFGTGYWNVLSGSGIFSDSSDHNAVVSGLQNGPNVFQWVVTDGICTAISQVVITYNTQISAIAGIDRNVCLDSVLLTATNPEFGSGYWQVISSTGTLADSSDAVTWFSGLNPGYNVLRWVVINGTCQDIDTLVIYLRDPSECIEDIEMPTGFTPNNDGKNDYFVIHGIEFYPDNIISVYNRWGNLVYEESGYNNKWEGVNQSNEPLPEGTYFVIFKVRSVGLVLKSYVDIRR